MISAAELDRLWELHATGLELLARTQLSLLRGSLPVALELRLSLIQHVRDGDFDSATQTVLIGNRLAALIGNGESVIQRLVGWAIAATMRILVEEMIQAPNCPNLYWAIATVPLPLVAMRKAIELELENIHRSFSALRDARTENWIEPEAKRRWVDAIIDLKKLAGPSSDPANLQLLQALDSSTYFEPAKSRLKATGLTDAQLDLMAPAVIVMADAAAELEGIRDESMMRILLPRLQRQDLREIQAKTNVDPEWNSSYLQSEWMGDQRTTNGGALFASVLFPGILQLEIAEIRTPVMYHRLMTLEAIRMHVATHNGEIPATLDQLSLLSWPCRVRKRGKILVIRSKQLVTIMCWCSRAISQGTKPHDTCVFVSDDRRALIRRVASC